MEERKPKILLAEDDTNLGMVLKNYLELNDYDVELCRDGILALAAFRREKFDICLLDIMMPNMDGFKLAEEIRDVDPDIPPLLPVRQNHEGRYHPGLQTGRG
ncbi:response regulator [Chitinophaga sp. W3I9]|uniref:response regulator n=1 Tax=Chitinophaga sp. W3I9 TaxID=3373924 RepID=UPI003D250B78